MMVEQKLIIDEAPICRESADYKVEYPLTQFEKICKIEEESE